jgi:hypothetical protein
MAKRGFLIFVVGFFLFSCVQPAYQRQNYYDTSKTATHTYELSVKDINGQSIEGAEIDYSLEKEHSESGKGKFITKSDGKMVVTVSKTDRPILNEVRFSSTLKYTITKGGYYINSGTEYAAYDSDRTIAIPVVLLKSTDYITPAFLSSPKGIEIKANILAFIDLIRLQSFLGDADLKPQTINLVIFKEKDYLQFTFVSSNTYNSLKLNKYDIGKKLFDDVVRKVLNPLNEHISNPKMFYGYDLKVIGHTKNFADKYSEYSAGTPIEYRFIIPGDIVKKYKNKDISGQAVLDSSVILMDDERIELKLQ